MTSLKAFVGHSFTSDDQEVVRTLLNFFDKVKDMNIGFAWEHAEPAEPRELAEKVKGLMEDKNLFIGICTRKEATIAPTNLSRAMLSKKILKAREDKFLWKTSDWIIQEIGLAIGRGMYLILLVESGLRQPGGLQGNLECISFDRQAPEKSFCKILEMIQSLIPKAKALAGGEAETRTAPVQKTEDEQQKDEEWFKPKPAWKRDHFEFALLHMIATENKESAKPITKAYLATEEGQIPQNRESWKAYQEYLLLTWSKGGKLTNLEELARACPENSEVQKYLAKGYQVYGEQEKAARRFETAAQKAGSQKQELARYGDGALAFARAGQKAEAKRVIERMKAIASGVENGHEQLVSALREIAEIETDKDALFGLTEKLLDLRPGDIELRFSLAYKYSEGGEGELSLFHYLKIPHQERESGTWNNLGVQFDHFDLNNKSVQAYRKAEELGDTLAMSNLAQKLIRAGFLEEAEGICNRAIKMENYHKNVGYAISRIKEMPEAEEKKETEIIQKATPMSDFYRDFGHALTANELGEHVGKWQGPDCELKVTIKENVFLAEGSFEQPFKPGAFSLLLAPQPTVQAQVSRYSVRYEGTVTGHAVKALYSKRKEGEGAPRSLLSSIGEERIEVLMIVSDSLRQLRVYEKGAAKDSRFYTLSRID